MLKFEEVAEGTQVSINGRERDIAFYVVADELMFSLGSPQVRYLIVNPVRKAFLSELIAKERAALKERLEENKYLPENPLPPVDAQE